MQDLIYVGVLIAFFAVAGLFVVACDKIIGSDEAALSRRRPADRHARARSTSRIAA